MRCHAEILTHLQVCLTGTVISKLNNGQTKKDVVHTTAMQAVALCRHYEVLDLIQQSLKFTIRILHSNLLSTVIHQTKIFRSVAMLQHSIFLKTVIIKIVNIYHHIRYSNSLSSILPHKFALPPCWYSLILFSLLSARDV